MPESTGCLRREGNCYLFESPLDACIDQSTVEPMRYQRDGGVPQIAPIDAELVFTPDANGGFTIGVRVTPAT